MKNNKLVIAAIAGILAAAAPLAAFANEHEAEHESNSCDSNSCDSNSCNGHEGEAQEESHEEFAE